MATDGPRTLIIGDEEAKGLFDGLKRLPSALDPGPLWLRSRPHTSIQAWAEHHWIKDALEEIANPKGVSPPDRPIDTILVALGRGQVLAEPDKVDQKLVDLVVGDALALVDQIGALGKFKVVWIMPLFAQNEGKTRAAIDAALRAKGVSMMPTIYGSRDWFADPSARGAYPKDIPSQTFDVLARFVQAGVPLRGPKPPPGAPPSTGAPADGPGGVITDAYTASVDAVRGMSTGVKVAGVLVLLGLGVGATYAATRRR
jgi:hypothetical protein